LRIANASLYFSLSSILEFCRRHTIQQLPWVSPELCTPLEPRYSTYKRYAQREFYVRKSI